MITLCLSQTKYDSKRKVFSLSLSIEGSKENLKILKSQMCFMKSKNIFTNIMWINVLGIHDL